MALINRCIVRNYLDFSMIAFPNSIENLTFTKEFTGELPVLDDFINLKELFIYAPIFWEYLSKLNLPYLETLDFVVDDSKEVCTLNFPNLLSLSIHNASKKNLTPIEKIISSNILTGYDFSNMKNLKSLKLSYFLGFDFNKTKFPKSLEELEITNSEIQNVDWCLAVKNLKKLILDNNSISNVHLLSYMPALEYLSLQNNDIEDAIELTNIDSLKYLNLLGNPIKNDKKLRQIANINTLIANTEDLEFKELKELASNLSKKSDEFMFNYNRFAKNRSAFVQIQDLKEKEIDFELRRQINYQRNFEYHFDRIDPFNHTYNHYSSNYKSLFVKFALEAGNNLIIKNTIKEKIENEKKLEEKGISNIIKSRAGVLLLAGDTGLYKIKLEKKQGSGKLIFDDIKINDRLKTILIRSAILTVCKTGIKSEVLEHDYTVKISNIYSNKIDSSVSLGITIAIYCLIKNIEIPTSTIIYSHLNTRGGLKNIEIKKHILSLFDKIGISDVIIGKSTQKALSLITDSMDLNLKLHICNKIDDIIKYISI